MVYVDRIWKAQDYIAQHLDTAGDGTGTTSAVGDYSSAEEIFFFKPTRRAEISQMLVYIRDATASWSSEDYGGINSGLTTGIRCRVSDDDGVVVNLDNGEAIKSNAAWGHVTYDHRIDTVGSGDSYLTAHWHFECAGIPVCLDPTFGEKLEVVLNDDLTGLDEHDFTIHGRYA